jgi:excisionase family DNA binding protein
MGRGRTRAKPIEDLAAHPGRFVTSHQLAEYFGVAHDTINNWIRRGRLQAAKPGGYEWRIPIEAARALEREMFVPREKSA